MALGRVAGWEESEVDMNWLVEKNANAASESLPWEFQAAYGRSTMWGISPLLPLVLLTSALLSESLGSNA